MLWGVVMQPKTPGVMWRCAPGEKS